MDPFASHRNVEALKGAKDLYRLRLADWRAIYRVDRAARAIVVQRIAKRGEVYR